MSFSGVGLGCTVLRDLFGTPELRAVLDSAALVQGWLDAEVALARAEADVGVIPESAAARIAAEGHVWLFDLDALREGVADSQHPLVPLIRALVARCGADGGYVHWGATTQDITDTGMMLQVRAAMALIRDDLADAARSAGDLAVAHNRDPMPGRTHGQHAVPIAFGLKAASWADELGRCLQRVDRLAQDVLCAQLAGAAGSLASLGADAAEVRSRFAAHLGLPEAGVGWHVARDRVRELAHVLGQIASAAERIAAEVVRLQATEVAELREPAVVGHVGSSTMPQKRNPMTSEYLIASARLVHGATAVLEFSSAHAGERDMGMWAVEWMAVPQALILTGGVASKLAWVLGGLEVDTERMRQNLGLTGGAIMAEAVMMEFADRWGHERAHQIVSEASRRAASRGTPFAVALLEDPAVAEAYEPDAVARLVAAPEAYLGSSAS
ncbi:MAG: 3-carboxy-cis,cis-muconate cycloisomerase [Gaiellales bacterium]|nr:3-carboxy-cis,cis-muconate cycloisomerase [Gaiellales bacterium]